MEFNLVQLRALVELSELQTMAAVANRTGYTPGAVSQQISQLERSVGHPLITPDGRRVKLTDLGKTVVHHATKVLSAADQTRKAIANVTDGIAYNVSLGIVTTASSNLLPRIARLASARFPRLRISTTELQVDEIPDAVLRGQIDLGIGIDYPHYSSQEHLRLTSSVLFTEDFLIAMSERQAAQFPGAVDLRDLSEWEWILSPQATGSARAFTRACQEHGFTPRVVHEMTNTSAALVLATREIGIVPVTPMILCLSQPPGLAPVPLLQPLKRTVTLIHRDNPAHKGSLVDAIEVIRAACAEVPSQTK